MSITIDAAKLMKSIEAEHYIEILEVRLSWAPDDGTGVARTSVTVLAVPPAPERIDYTIEFTK